MTTSLIWVGLLAVVFGVMWYRGDIKRLAAYVAETREELRKCTWPTVAELKGSTMVVIVSIAILGAFTVAVDSVLFQIFFKVL
jgi:preprotein translocase subunit SecE